MTELPQNAHQLVPSSMLLQIRQKTLGIAVAEALYCRWLPSAGRRVL